MLIRSHLKSRGDTLIEVLFAITIFSLVAVGGLAIMNQGTATSQRALEITLVRQEIDAQAETLRFLNSSYVAAYQNGASCPSPSVTLPGPAAQWQAMQCSIIATGTVTASSFGAGATCSTPPEGSFILNTRNATFVPPTDTKLGQAQTFSQVRYDDSGQVVMAEGIWIEAVRSAVNNKNDPQYNAAYVDFNIRACWDSPGQSVPVTIGTIVRLYEPRG